MKISVVIPAYNAEKYIGDLIESIFNQTLQDFEIIVVDDGSTDNTLNLLNEFSKDKRLKVFSKPNGGVASARNFGIEKLSGEYVIFPDADDTLQSNMFEVLYKEAVQTDADICICAYNNIHTYSNKTYIRRLDDTNVAQLSMCDYVLKLRSNQLFNSVWNKLYRRSILKDVKFQTIPFGEDTIFNLDLFSHNVSLHYVDIPLYNYFSRGKDNSMNIYHPNYENTICILYNRWKSFLVGDDLKNQKAISTLNNLYVSSNWQIFKNLFLKNSPYSFKERLKYIKTNLYKDSYFKDITKVQKLSNVPKSIRIYTILYKKNSPLLLNTVYTFLFRLNFLLKNV